MPSALSRRRRDPAPRRAFAGSRRTRGKHSSEISSNAALAAPRDDLAQVIEGQDPTVGFEGELIQRILGVSGPMAVNESVARMRAPTSAALPRTSDRPALAGRSGPRTDTECNGSDAIQLLGPDTGSTPSMATPVTSKRRASQSAGLTRRRQPDGQR